MVKLQLSIKADLINVTDLAPLDPDYDFHFKIKCNSCQEVSNNWISMNQLDTHPISGSRGEANLVMRCKFCKREGSASFEKGTLRAYQAEQSGRFAPLIQMECRGLEPVECQLTDGWKVVGADSNTKFDEVDLSEGVWADYDEKAGNEVSVMDVEFQITKA
ncbi:hypothetical protein IWQ61_002875 [Dispira simplex]|nr:hypothetical protein IWQ61_002875 [Dispira simplex]